MKLSRDSGHICTVCGASDQFAEKKLPHNRFCEHCYEVIDDWFDDLCQDLRTSVKAWRGREITDEDVMDALETYFRERIKS